MGDSKRRRELKFNRFSAGLCIYCGKNPFKINTQGCSLCLEKKYLKHKERLKKNPDIQRNYHLKIRKEVLEKYGNKCKCCGENNWSFLVIDHVNNDGHKERRELYGSQSGSAHSFFLKLRREPLRIDLQVLCWNCNAAKSMYGECPHNVK